MNIALLMKKKGGEKMQEIYKKIWKGFGFVLFAALLLFPAASVRAESEKLCNEEEAKVPEGYVISEEETGEEITCMEVEGTCGDSASWILDNGVLTISGSGDMSDYSTSNDPGWYSDRLSVKSIVIEDGITSIGKMAFYNYSASVGAFCRMREFTCNNGRRSNEDCKLCISEYCFNRIYHRKRSDLYWWLCVFCYKNSGFSGRRRK